MDHYKAKAILMKLRGTTPGDSSSFKRQNSLVAIKLKSTRVLSMIGIAGGVLLIIIGYLIYSYTIEKPAQTDKSENEILLDQLSRIVELPSAENPTIATVTDVEKLKKSQSSPFLNKAENGDKVLVYAVNGKAILFRPSTGKVIDISLISAESSASATESGKTEDEIPVQYTYIIYNGTSVNGLAKKMEDQLKGVFPESQVLKLDNAKQINYKETVLIDLTGQNAGATEKIAQKLGVKVGSLPDSEARPSQGQFLLIVGKDRVEN